MSRRITLTGTFLGGDVSNVNIFHTTASAENLLLSNVATSSLKAGVNVDAPDSATHFIARVIGGVCQLATGSIDIVDNSTTLRHFTFLLVDQDGASESEHNGSITVLSPVGQAGTLADGTSDTGEISVNYASGENLQVQFNAVYPDTFIGLYSSGSGTSTELSTDNPLTFALNDFTGSNDTRRDTYFVRIGSS